MILITTTTITTTIKYTSLRYTNLFAGMQQYLDGGSHSEYLQLAPDAALVAGHTVHYPGDIAKPTGAVVVVVVVVVTVVVAVVVGEEKV